MATQQNSLVTFLVRVIAMQLPETKEAMHNQKGYSKHACMCEFWFYRNCEHVLWIDNPALNLEVENCTGLFLAWQLYHSPRISGFFWQPQKFVPLRSVSGINKFVLTPGWCDLSGHIRPRENSLQLLLLDFFKFPFLIFCRGIFSFLYQKQFLVLFSVSNNSGSNEQKKEDKCQKLPLFFPHDFHQTCLRHPLPTRRLRPLLFTIWNWPARPFLWALFPQACPLLSG